MLSIAVMQHQHAFKEPFEPSVWNAADLEEALRQAGLAYVGEHETLVSSHALRVFALLAPPAPGEPPAPWEAPKQSKNTLRLKPGTRTPLRHVTEPLKPRCKSKERAAQAAASAVAMNKPSRGIVRWPVVFCGLLACTMSLVAFLRSPLATVPAVRPYAAAVEQALGRGYMGVETAAHRAILTAANPPR